MQTLDGNRPFEQSIGFKKYEVDINRCQLNVGESVTPDTIIGWHHETGEPVTAGFYGQVATIYFNPMHDSLLIMAVTRNN